MKELEMTIENEMELLKMAIEFVTERNDGPDLVMKYYREWKNMLLSVSGRN